MTTLDQSETPLFHVRNGFEVYPMPMFAAIGTADVSALVDWYQAALGFAVMFKMAAADGRPVLVHLRRRKYQDLLVRHAMPRGDSSEQGTWSLCFQADENIDELAARAAAVPLAGKVRLEPAVDTPWNTREFHIVDPDGRQLVFSQPRFDPQLTVKMRREFEAGRIDGS